MSETAQPHPERIRRSTGNRDAESVNRAIGHISEMLNRRVAALPMSNGSLVEADSTGPENAPNMTTTYYYGRADGRAGQHIEVQHWPTNRGLEDVTEISVHDGNGSLKIQTKPDYAEASLHPQGADQLAEEDLIIKDPAMVGDVAANTLNRLRGHIADGELAVKQQEADARNAVRKKMIDFVNSKK